MAVTIVAGIIADAVMDAPVKFVSCKILDDSGNGLLSEMVAGLQYAMGRADVINLSAGSDGCDGAGELVRTIFHSADGKERRARERHTAFEAGPSPREGEDQGPEPGGGIQH